MMDNSAYMMDMAGWGAMHWLMMLIVAVLVIYPTSLILRRLGYSQFWAVLVLVPGVNLIGLWVVAMNADERTRA